MVTDWSIWNWCKKCNCKHLDRKHGSIPMDMHSDKLHFYKFIKTIEGELPAHMKDVDIGNFKPTYAIYKCVVCGKEEKEFIGY